MGTKLLPQEKEAHSPCLLWPNGWMIKMPLGTEVDHGPSHIVLDGDPARHPRKDHSSPLFSARIYCGNGCPSQLLLSSCILLQHLFYFLCAVGFSLRASDIQSRRSILSRQKVRWRSLICVYMCTRAASNRATSRWRNDVGSSVYSSLGKWTGRDARRIQRQQTSGSR